MFNAAMVRHVPIHFVHTGCITHHERLRYSVYAHPELVEGSESVNSKKHQLNRAFSYSDY
jgi:hypothetical protein